jgi:glutamine phosphoribosylpyrophosphate amidotransferase
MCGIVGIVSLDKRPVKHERFNALMEEARIRGQHAHGYAYVDGDKVRIHSQAGPFTKLPDDIETVALIGHCRYSTSDLLYNQPIGDDAMAVVHNGVISQSDPSTWYDEFGVKCSGRNDTEILFRLAQIDMSPLVAGGSQAACLLTANYAMLWRNEYRPAYFSIYEGQLVFASTADILYRSLGVQGATELMPCQVIRVDLETGTITTEQRRESKEDMQHATV